MPTRVSYAHLLTRVNPKHVESLVGYFEAGCVARGEGMLGVEIEHLPVHADGTAAGYSEPNGVEELLRLLRPYYDPAREYWEHGHLLGLGRDGLVISLEPGAQVETSIGVLRSPDELSRTYAAFRKETDPMLAELGWDLAIYGYQPRTGFADIEVIPKSRYAAMTEYLGRIGQFGPCMMRCSAATQISIDYTDEADCIAKMRLGCAVGPILAWFFRNTPYFEGGPSPWPLTRQRIWDLLDPQRTGLPAGLYGEGYGWEDYAADMLATPLMFADLTHTPEAVGEVSGGKMDDCGGMFGDGTAETSGTAGIGVDVGTTGADATSSRLLRFAAFRESAAEIYPDRALNDYEIAHVLSTHFPDVRLKHYLELRHWDSLPIDRAQNLTNLVAGLFYDPARRAALASVLDGITEADVLAAKADLQAHGSAARPYGRDLDSWASLLRVDA